jgi:amicyanin
MNTQTQNPVRRRRGLIYFGVGAASIAAVILLIAYSGGGGGTSSYGMQGMNMAGMTAPANAQSGTPIATTTVSIKNFGFSPATITVKAGSNITWTNNDAVDHTVTFDGGTVSSTDLGTNDTFSHAFATPGTYHYICTIHPFMHGTVIVTA